MHPASLTTHSCSMHPATHRVHPAHTGFRVSGFRDLGCTPCTTCTCRHRVLFNTLLANEPGVEGGLVQRESPFCGSKRFGACYYEGRGRLALVGTVVSITDFLHLPDGRISLTGVVGGVPAQK